MNVADRTVDLIPSQKISFADNYEGMLEYFDTLMRYLYAVKKEELKKNDIETHGEIHPFGIPEFEQITYYDLLRALTLNFVGMKYIV